VTPDLFNAQTQKKAVKTDKGVLIFPTLAFAHPMLSVSVMGASLHSVSPEKMEHRFNLNKSEGLKTARARALLLVGVFAALMWPTIHLCLFKDR